MPNYTLRYNIMFLMGLAAGLCFGFGLCGLLHG